MEKKSIIKIGIYVTLAAIILVWGLSFLKGGNLLSKGNEYVAVYNRLEGLSEGSPVMISGYRIGSVKSLKFIDNGYQLNIIANLSVNDGFQIPKGSVANIVSVDIMGTKGVEIARPRQYDGYHKDGDTIMAGFDGGIMDMAMDIVAPLRDNLGSLLKGADSAMCSINSLMNTGNMENLSQSLSDLRKMADMMAANSANINGMLDNLGKASNMLGKNSENMDRAINNFAAISDSLASMNLGQTLKDAQTALNNVNQALDAINNGSGTAAQILNNDTLYRNLETATQKINFLLDDFEKHPKKYVNLAIFGGKDKDKPKK